MSALLQTRALSVRYGGVRALSDVDLEVHAGQLVGLIGPNGAGKTTFTDAVTGFAACTGSVSLDGREVSSLPSHRRATLGLVRTWQSAEVFDDLSVRDNLLVASAQPTLREVLKQLATGRSTDRQAVDDALSLLALEGLADVPADALTQGQRKLVGVARALAARPKVLCLDEPAAGLDTHESRRLGEHLREIVATGVGALLIDHDMGLVMSVCDHVVVLNFGEVIASGPPDVVRRDPTVVKAYLGASANDVREKLDV
jgi:branched-chain amino acid transport system ATP-binding protein